MRHTPILIAALAGLLIAGCNSEDTSNIKEDTQKLTKHVGEALSSSTVAGKVQAVLGWRKDVDIKGLHIEANHGDVKISGHVGSAAEKRRVIDTANQIVGVDSVDASELRIASDEKPDEKGDDKNK